MSAIQDIFVRKVKRLERNRREVRNSLKFYKEQLLARHKEDPTKPPPVFLLDMAISLLEREISGE